MEDFVPFELVCKLNKKRLQLKEKGVLWINIRCLEVAERGEEDKMLSTSLYR